MKPEEEVRRRQVRRLLLALSRLRQGRGRQSRHQRGASQYRASHLPAFSGRYDGLQDCQGTGRTAYLDGHGQGDMEREDHPGCPHEREIHGMRENPEDLHAGLPHQESRQELRTSAELLRGTEPSRYHRPAVFEMVQQEMERRTREGRSYSGVSIFSGKIRCGECGGSFGAKVWHSTDKYRRTTDRAYGSVRQPALGEYGGVRHSGRG